MEQALFEFSLPERRVYSVAELSSALRTVLEREFFDVWVSGEISGVKLATSGHYYFTLKDEGAQLRCVCFRSTARFLKFKPQDGLAAIARGRLDLYEARGEYQLLVEFLEPQGHGALQLAFEQLKKKLAAEGLFEPGRKRPLPRYPRRIGIVTSPKGAVIQDMLQILERRSPGLHIRVYPALVQGEGSVDEVCRGIQYFSRSGWPDLVIVARGGGSLEDLWTFNEEAVARAIAASAVPVISAVGHETDITIADFVADLRAPTPSAAAEMAVRTRAEILEQIGGAESRLVQWARFRVSLLRQQLHRQGIERVWSVLHRSIGRRLQRIDGDQYRLRELLRGALTLRRRALEGLDTRLLAFDPRPRLARQHRRRESAAAAAAHAVRLAAARRRAKLDALRAHLTQLSPLAILSRGYAIVSGEDGRILTRAAAAPEGSPLSIRLAEGRLRARVTEVESMDSGKR